MSVLDPLYIPPEGVERLPHYKYAGEDRSLIYKHVLTPMNKVLVELIPEWVAPNLITLTGFLFVTVSHFVMFYHSPHLEGAAPGWAYVLNGLCLLAYQTLDNLDGRQARRTGSSSPLGLLFDHGCDALNCTVGALTFASTLQMGASWKALVVLLTAVIMFFMNTWEEYYRGALILPVFNGPTEGLLMGAALYFYTAAVGPGWWLQRVSLPVYRPLAVLADAAGDWLPHWKGVLAELEARGVVAVQYNTVVIWVLLAMCGGTIIGNVWNVYVAISASGPHGHGKHPGVLSGRFPFLHAVTRLVPLLLVTSLAAVWVALSPTQIMDRHPRLILWTVGLLFAKLVTHLMLAHLCDIEYHPFRRTLMPFFALAAHVAFSYINRSAHLQIDEELVLFEFFGLATVTYLHLVFGVVRQMRQILRIRCFHIPVSPKQKPA